MDQSCEMAYGASSVATARRLRPMRWHWVRVLVAILCTTVAPRALADDPSPTNQSPELARAPGKPETTGNIENTFVVGIGGAAEVELADGSFHPGVNLMFEWGAIENWLEIELGVSVLAAEGGVEVPVDLLFKKPFRLSPRAELFVGLGPQIVHVANPTTKATYFGAEFALDFFYWQSQRFGLWVEPSFGVVFRDNVSTSIGVTAGLIVGW